MTARKRVLIIGLDGFTWTLGHDLMVEGVMPLLGQLVEKGCHGNLQSVTPSETAPAWTSFQTGCRPGKTGVYAFHTYDRKLKRIRLYSFADIAVPSLWELAHRAGKRVVSLNMPVSSPPPKVDGVIIPGLLCPELSPETCHPPEAYDRYVKPQKNYMIVNNTHRETVIEFAEQSIATERARCAVAKEIMNDVDWDIFCFQAQSTDLMQHRTWWALDRSAKGHCQSDREQALSFYRCCDEIIAELRKAAGPDTLTLVVSDHGFCRAKGSISVNVWLRKNGYLKLPPARPDTKWAVVKKRIPPLKLLARAYGGTRKIVLNFMQYVRQLATGREYTPPFSEIELKHLRQLIDFERTDAFCLGSMGGMLYINSETSQKAELSEKLTSQLLRDFGPDSEIGAITKISPGEEFYGKSAKANTLPDLVLEYAEGFSSVINPLGEEVVTIPSAADRQQGTHAGNGVFVIQGDAVKTGEKIDAAIVDIAPTVLAYLGIAVPEHMDGKVLNDVFVEPLAVEYEDVAFDPSRAKEYTDEEQAEVERNLSDLGYL